jgi:hypothetical protein
MARPQGRSAMREVCAFLGAMLAIALVLAVVLPIGTFFVAKWLGTPIWLTYLLATAAPFACLGSYMAWSRCHPVPPNWG